MAGVAGIALMQDLLAGGLDQVGYVPHQWFACLFTDAWSPSSDDALSDYTIPTDALYARIPLINTTWDYLVAGSLVKARYPLLVWTFAGGAMIYGYFIEDASGTLFGGAEAFGIGPTAIPTFGGPLILSIEIDLMSP